MNLRVIATFFTIVFSGLLFSGTVCAADADLKKAEALIREGKAAEAYNLLEPLEVELAGDVNYDYLLATAALNSGQPSKASFIYERILAVQPNFIGVRADMGRAYFAMENYARARIEFETVLTFQNSPPDLKSAAQQYLSAIEQRQQGKRTVAVGYMELSVGRDSNINSSTGQNPIDANGLIIFLDPQSQPTRATYGQYGFGGEVNHLLDDNYGVYAGADVRGRSYDGYPASGYGTLDVRAGVSYATGANLYRGGIAAGRYNLDGNGAVYNGSGTRDYFGVTADWRHAVSTSHQLLVSLAYNENRYIDPALRVNDFDLTALIVGWTSAVGSAGAVNATASLGFDNSVNGRDDGDRKYFGLRLSAQSPLFGEVSGFVSLSAQKSIYADVNPSFAVKRDDTLSDATIGLNWNFADRWILRPLVTVIRNRSNIGLNAFDRTDGSITLRRDFY